MAISRLLSRIASPAMQRLRADDGPAGRWARRVRRQVAAFRARRSAGSLTAYLDGLVVEARSATTGSALRDTRGR